MENNDQTGQERPNLSRENIPISGDGSSFEASEQKKLQDQIVELLGGRRAYDEYTLEKFVVIPENEKAFRWVKEFDPDKTNVFLWGPCGTGKSHLISALVRRWHEKKKAVALMRVPELHRLFRKMEAHEEQDHIRRFSRRHVLALDDLGRGNLTDYWLQILCEIVENRWLSGRNGLVIASNFNLEQLADKCGEDRLTSRLACMCDVIRIGGSDWRLKKRVMRSNTL